MTMIFLGYATEPEVNRETLYFAGREIASTGAVEVKSWEDLKIGGRVIIQAILEAIDAAATCIFDVSMLNSNVLFELGYAIARNKRIWVLLDRTDAEAAQRWKQFQLLTSVSYVGWANAEELKVAFLRERPDLAPSTLYHDLIEQALVPSIPGSILYLPPYNLTEPARQISRRLEQERLRGVRLITADPSEASLNPLQWYAAKAYET